VQCREQVAAQAPGVRHLYRVRLTEVPDGGERQLVLVRPAATVPFALAGPHTNEWLLALCLVVRGFGLGAVTIPVMAVAFLGLDKQQIAHSSVVTRTVQQIGGSFGTAVLAVILTATLTAHHADPGTGFDLAFWWATGFSALAVVLSLWLPGAPRTRADDRATRPWPAGSPAGRPASSSRSTTRP